MGQQYDAQGLRENAAEIAQRWGADGVLPNVHNCPGAGINFDGAIVELGGVLMLEKSPQGVRWKIIG